MGGYVVPGVFGAGPQSPAPAPRGNGAARGADVPFGRARAELRAVGAARFAGRFFPVFRSCPVKVGAGRPCGAARPGRGRARDAGTQALPQQRQGRESSGGCEHQRHANMASDDFPARRWQAAG